MKQHTWGRTCVFHTRHGVVPPTASTKHGSFERLFQQQMSQSASFGLCDMGHGCFDTNHIYLSITNSFIMTW